MTMIPQDEPVTTANLLRHMAEDWQALQAWLDATPAAQLTQPRDAEGWSAKDHVIHLALWEGGLLALLQGKPQREALGVDEATWEAGEDQTNNVNQRRYQALSLAEARQMLQQSHARLIAHVATMTDADLQRPRRDFGGGSDQSDPIWGWIVGNTFMHYREHQPWMTAIATQG